MKRRSAVHRFAAWYATVALAASARVHAQDTEASTRAKRDVLWGRMEDSIRAIVRATDAVVGVAVLDLTDQRPFLLNGDVVYPTASTIKIALLAELFRQDERGGVKLGDVYTLDAKDLVGGSGIMSGFTPGVTHLTNRDLATLMVGVSDNSATNVLIDRVGMEKVNESLARLGLKETRLRRHMMDTKAAQAGRENTTTPRELVTLLDSLYAGTVLSKGGTDAYFKLLATTKSAYIPRSLPADVMVASKPGDLDGVRNDAGVVFVPGRPFAIAVMTTYGRDERAQEESISRIARVAWEYFDRVAKSSPLGRRIS